MTYLGTNLSPIEYYLNHSKDYVNPHYQGILEIISKFKQYLVGRILDLGCGDGLASSIIKSNCIGSDNSPEMLKRYIKETGNKGFLKEFWEEQPKCNSIVACYSLHLCPISRISMVSYRLLQTETNNIVIITPFKNNPTLLSSMFEEVDQAQAFVPGKNKRIYGKVLKRKY